MSIEKRSPSSADANTETQKRVGASYAVTSGAIGVRETVIRKVAGWAIITIDPLLLIVHLTLIYIVFLIADNLLLFSIERSYGNIIEESEFAVELLKGIRIFSALGTAIAYALHIIYALYKQARHVIKTYREMLDQAVSSGLKTERSVVAQDSSFAREE